MKPATLRVCLTLASIALIAIAVVVIRSRDNGNANRATAAGLDHIPLAVKDLGEAAERFKQMGFTLKPGRPHKNGIRNQHIKFAGGTELELITAPEARDRLSTEYVQHLSAGDGPAFVGLFAPDMDAAAQSLDAAKTSYSRAGGLLTFAKGSGLRHIFLGRRIISSTDRPKYFRHANGADALIGVWLAGDDFTAERSLLETLGVTVSTEEVHVPSAEKVPVARLQEAEIVFLPASRQLVPGRRIVGAVLRTRDREALRRALAGSKLSESVQMNARSAFVPPAMAHGIWLEFREGG